MKKYNRNFDQKNIEGRANKNYRSGHGGRKRQRDWAPPGYLNEYEKSEWLQNTFTKCTVKRRANDTNDFMIRRFKKMVEDAGIMRELKKREHYLSPTQRKKEKKKRALKRLRRRMKIVQQEMERKENEIEKRQNAQYAMSKANKNHEGGDR